MPIKFVKWTDEQVERLKALHAQQYSCAIISSMLEGNFTRNAVIGKLHRLGLSNVWSTVHRDNQFGKKPPRRKKENRKTIRIVKANGNSNQQRIMESSETYISELRCVEVTPRHIALLDLQRHDCRYPYGNSPFTFCGHTALDGKSYCGPHYALSRTSQRPISPAVQEQRRRTLRANYKTSFVEVA